MLRGVWTIATPAAAAAAAGVQRPLPSSFRMPLSSTTSPAVGTHRSSSSHGLRCRLPLVAASVSLRHSSTTTANRNTENHTHEQQQQEEGEAHPFLSSRIPYMGHKTTARLRWATYTFWHLLDPLFRRHFRYYRQKVALDRWLEKNHVLTNTLLGVLLGVTLYVAVSTLCLPALVGSPLKEEAGEAEGEAGEEPVVDATSRTSRHLPSGSLREELKRRSRSVSESPIYSMQENSEAVVALMGDPSSTKELPAFQLMRIKREIMGKLYEVSDLAEVRRQRQEVEDMKRTLAMLQQQQQQPLREGSGGSGGSKK